MANLTNVLGSDKLKGQFDINFGCICIWEIRNHVKFKKWDFKALMSETFFFFFLATREHNDF